MQQVDAGGVLLSLETDVWRDFERGSPPGGTPMIAALRVTTVGGGVFPAQIALDSCWIIYGDRAWATRALVEYPPQPRGPSYEAVAREGPRWGPLVLVDVVVRLTDLQGHVWFLSARNQTVIGTY